MKINLTIPENLSEITLAQYQKFNALNPELDYDLRINKMIQIFCNCPQANLLPASEVRETVKHLNGILNQEGKVIPRFHLGTGESRKEFGLIPDIQNISFGEFVDLEKYLGRWETFHQAMAILFRPIIKSSKHLYEIEEYRGSALYSEVMKYTPMDVVFGSVVFFWTLEKDLLQASLTSLGTVMKKNKKTSQQGGNFQKNGAGLLPSTNSLMETLRDMKPSLNNPSPYALPHFFLKEKKKN
jgi:hypothetical protein